MSIEPPVSSVATASSGLRQACDREAPSHDAPLPKGDRNLNPRGISFWALIAEDFQTYDRGLVDPCFLAVVIHRYGNARMSIRPKLLRAPFSLVYKFLFNFFWYVFGINLPYSTLLGRRVRIWHHGGLWLGARSIGDDVHIRHNTTFGLLSRNEPNGKPIIGNRVDLAPGVCVLGAVTIGDDCVIGPNSVVIRDVPAGSAVLGVPARQTSVRKPDAMPSADGKPAD